MHKRKSINVYNNGIRAIALGKTAGHGDGHPCVPNHTQAKRAGPKLEAGP
jgi:hypothetical protein